MPYQRIPCIRGVASDVLAGIAGGGGMMGHSGGGVGIDGDGGDGSKAGDSLGGGRGRRRKRGRGDPRFRRRLADVRKVNLCDTCRMVPVPFDRRLKQGWTTIAGKQQGTLNLLPEHIGQKQTMPKTADVESCRADQAPLLPEAKTPFMQVSPPISSKQCLRCPYALAQTITSSCCGGCPGC